MDYENIPVCIVWRHALYYRASVTPVAARMSSIIIHCMIIDDMLAAIVVTDDL